MRAGIEPAVLDASAILAIIFSERGADVVSDYLERGLVSAVNLSEAAAKLIDRGADPERAASVLRDLGLTTVAFGEQEAFASGGLRLATHAAGLSLGDRACLALAAREGVAVVTADRAFARVDIGVTVEVFR